MNSCLGCKRGSRRDLNPCNLKMFHTLDPACKRYTTCPFGYWHIPCGSGSVLANPQSHPPGYRGRLCDSTGNQTLTPKRQGGMIEEELPDPIEHQGPVGGGGSRSRNSQRSRSRNCYPSCSPATKPGFPTRLRGSRIPSTWCSRRSGGWVPPEVEEIRASPVTPETQIEQIEADNALAEQLQADEQMLADDALARQLQALHSITVPRVWPENGQIPESMNTPGACGSRDILHPDSNDPAAHIQQLPETIGETEEQFPRDDPRHPRQSSDIDNSSDICYDWSFSSASRSP